MTDIEVRLQRAGRELREFDPDPPPFPGDLSAGLSTRQRSGTGVASLALGLIAVIFGVGIVNGNELPERLTESASVIVDEAASPIDAPTSTSVDAEVPAGADEPAAELIVPDVREEILLIRAITTVAPGVDDTTNDHGTPHPTTLARDPRLAVMF